MPDEPGSTPGFFLFRLTSCFSSAVIAVFAAGLLLKIVRKLSGLQLSFLFLVMYFILLDAVCMAGIIESGTVKHILIFGHPVQVTVLTKLTAAGFFAPTAADNTMRDSQKFYS